jgi:hypothetical protein
MIAYRLFALAFVICGVSLFIHFSGSQRQFDARLHSVSTGEVQPEMLTVISKHARRSTKSAEAWVVFRSSRQAQIVYPVPRTTPRDRQLYDTLNPGSTVTGYYFPDGYFIPQLESDRDAGTAKWVFLGGSISIAAIAFAISFLFQKKPQSGRTTPVADSEALGRPHRSVPSL